MPTFGGSKAAPCAHRQVPGSSRNQHWQFLAAHRRQQPLPQPSRALPRAELAPPAGSTPPEGRSLAQDTPHKGLFLFGRWYGGFLW